MLLRQALFDGANMYLEDKDLVFFLYYYYKKKEGQYTP